MRKQKMREIYEKQKPKPNAAAQPDRDLRALRAIVTSYKRARTQIKEKREKRKETTNSNDQKW